MKVKAREEKTCLFLILTDSTTTEAFTSTEVPTTTDGEYHLVKNKLHSCSTNGLISSSSPDRNIEIVNTYKPKLHIMGHSRRVVNFLVGILINAAKALER